MTQLITTIRRALMRLGSAWQEIHPETWLSLSPQWPMMFPNPPMPVAVMRPRRARTFFTVLDQPPGSCLFNHECRLIPISMLDLSIAWNRSHMICLLPLNGPEITRLEEQLGPSEMFEGVGEPDFRDGDAIIVAYGSDARRGFTKLIW